MTAGDEKTLNPANHFPNNMMSKQDKLSKTNFALKLNVAKKCGPKFHHNDLQKTIPLSFCV